MITRTTKTTLFPYTTLFRSIKMDIYKINLEIFCDNWSLDPDCKKNIYKFLLQLKKGKTIKEVYYRLIKKMDKDRRQDRKSTRLNSSHVKISYAVFCLKKKKK